MAIALVAILCLLSLVSADNAGCGVRPSTGSRIVKEHWPWSLIEKTGTSIVQGNDALSRGWPWSVREKTGPRIVQGHNAQPHAWPWQVSVRENGGHTCGGTLIRSDWVLTATHCIIMNPNARSYTVVVGAHRRKGMTDVQQEIQVTKIYKHTGFKLYHYKDDIALLKLARPAKLSSKVTLACLPTAEAVVGDKCYVTGWGFLTQTGPLPDILQQAEAPIASHADCKRQYKTGIYRYTHLCAGHARNDASAACQGDSGGPLVCKVNGRWALQGVVSFGVSGCLPSHYTVFTRVSSYLNWIYQRIGEPTVNPPPTRPPIQPTPKQTTVRPVPSTRPPVQKTTRKPTNPAPTIQPSKCRDKATRCSDSTEFCGNWFMKRMCRRTCNYCKLN